MSFAKLNEKQLPESLFKRIEEMEKRIIELEKEVSELKKPKQKGN
jgi:regulator of replication initiation timing